MARRQIEVANEVAAGLAGSQDAILKTLDGHLDCDVFLRGNVVTLEGDDEAPRVAEHRAGGPQLGGDLGGRVGVVVVDPHARGGAPVLEAPAHAVKLEKTAAADPAIDGWRLLMSPPIILNLIFFILLSFCGGGLSNYLVASLGALYGTPATVANTALTGLLIMSAIGVLIGGVLTGFTTRHGLVASCGLTTT